jgi:hypothetical protein
MKIRSGKFVWIALLPVALTMALICPVTAHAQGFGMAELGGGRFSMGAGAYQAPDEAMSDSGLFSFARYELTSFAFEIDYGMTDQDFFLGAADYLYHLPTAGGITQTEIAVGGGVTFINNDPGFDGSDFGPNLMGQLRFADKLALQLRYDFLGESANLWTFGLSYDFF